MPAQCTSVLDDARPVGRTSAGPIALRARQTTLEAIAAGARAPSGFDPRNHPVNASLRLGTGFAWTLR